MSMVKGILNRFFLIVIMVPGAVFCANALQYPYSTKEDFLKSNLGYCFINGVDHSDGFTEYGVLFMQMFKERHKRKRPQDNLSLIAAVSASGQSEMTMQDYTGQAIEWMEELFRRGLSQEQVALEKVSESAVSTAAVAVCVQSVPPSYFTGQGTYRSIP